MRDVTNEELLRELHKRLTLSEKTIQDQHQMLAQMKELNKKLEQSEALKGHFISNIKNEINNPLTSILALSLNMLQREDEMPAGMVKSMRLVYNEAHTLDFQLANIMTAAEIEAGQVVPQLIATNVSQIIDQVISSFKNYVEKKRIKITTNGEKQIHFVTDPRYFKIIISNLISNALKFSPEYGNVDITLSQDVDQIKVTVSDTGDGIAKNDLSKIFDRFTQLDSGTIKKYQGHGLGLSVTRDLVELLDGSIDVISRNSQTHFTIHLPLNLSEDEMNASNESEFLFDQTF